jgi:hypothetical protein
MMKKLIGFILLLLLLCISVFSQNNNLENIKRYCYEVNKDSLVDNILREIYINHSKEYLEFDVFFNDKESIAKMKSNNSIIMPYLILDKSKLSNFSFDKNIYDYLVIDSNVTTIGYYDTLSNKLYTLNYKGHSYMVNNISKTIIYRNPEIIFAVSMIFADNKFNSNLSKKHRLRNLNKINVNYMFLKEDKIYVYRSKYKKIYELNDFVRKFLDEKEFIKMAKIYKSKAGYGYCK